MSVVNVLTPNGRRQNVKVQPNTAILKVLEEVCEKHKFDPNEYDLKHHKRIVDLTTSFRFSGLPNNAQLEMVEAQKKRQDAEVELVLQLSDMTRVEGKFKPNTMLLDIIKELAPNELISDDLFTVYMRVEVSSEKLGTTSLKDLGLISGRAFIRITRRDPNAAKIQANVALNLPKPSESKCTSDEKPEYKMRKTNDFTKDGTSLSISNEIEEQNKMEQVMEEQKIEEEIHDELAVIENQKLDSSVEKMEINSPTPTPTSDDDEDPGEIHILGERNAVLFMQDSARSANLHELPDSFFDLNINDLKVLIKHLRTQAEGTVEQPLMTAKLREMEETQKQISTINKYNKTIIRIQFPNRYVLQGIFTPYETIETVTEFVRSYLADQKIQFYLYTTPPKQILPQESRLFEAKCVPSMILHFGSDEKQPNYLKEEILKKVSSPKASIIQAFADRGIKSPTNVAPNEEDQPSTSQQPRRSNPLNYCSSSTTSTSSDVKFPKWFKSSRK